MSAVGGEPPKTTEAWEKQIAVTDSGFAPLIDEALRKAPVKLSEEEIAGVTVRILVPDGRVPLREEVLLINLHGGGYTQFGGDCSIMESISMAAAGFKVIAVDYRMPPRHPFPAAVDDGVAVYEAMLEHYQASNIAIYGASAGGGLSAAVIIAARDKGLPLPAAAVLHTPWSDLAPIGDSYATNEGVDPTLPSYEMLRHAALLYAGEARLDNPLVSPVYADYSKGFPPTLLSTGTRDLLLNCTVRQHRKLREANIPAELHVFDAMWHGFGLMVPTEQAELERETIQFLERHLHSVD